MSGVSVLVIRAPGTNCDEETMHAWRLAGANPTLAHIEACIDRPAIVREFHIVTFPGGFSYGDDIAAGKVFAAGLQSGLAEELHQLVERGGGVLGICNGFQVLAKAGLLPGGSIEPGRVTVTYNASCRFEARWVRLRVCRDDCPYLPRGATLELPVEHGEGRVLGGDESALARLESERHVALRYVGPNDQSPEYPYNPNGSDNAIAGLCDPTGRVFGLMPHPERHLDPTNHPLWTRHPPREPADGLSIFQSAVAFWR